MVSNRLTLTAPPRRARPPRGSPRWRSRAAAGARKARADWYGYSPALRKAVNGKSTLAFTSLDDDAAAEVKGLLARAFEIYSAG